MKMVMDWKENWIIPGWIVNQMRHSARATNLLIDELKILLILTRNKDPLMQPVRTTCVALTRYIVVSTCKGSYGSGLSITKKNVEDKLKDRKF